MKVIGKALLASGALALLTAAGGAQAAGWYIGVGAGVSGTDDLDSASGSDFESALGDSGLTATVSRFDTDDSDTGYRLFGGYRFNDYFAFEAFYTDLGSFDVSFAGTADDGSGPVDFSGSASLEVEGFGVYGVFSYPLWAGFNVMGKVGGIHWRSDMPISVTVDSSTVSDSIGDDGSDFAWGGGLVYHVNEHLAVDVQYERFDVFEDIDLVSANVSWGF